MTSRERVHAALRHRQPDRPPIDLSGHRSSGISAIAYRRLRTFLGLEARLPRVYDPVQQLAMVDEDVLQLFGVDTVELGRGFAQGSEHWAGWTLPDGSPCLMPAWALPERTGKEWVYRSPRTGRLLGRMPEGGLYFEQTFHSFEEQEDLDAIPEALAEDVWSVAASPPGPIVEGPGGYERLCEGARDLRASTDRAIVGLFGGNLMDLGQGLYRMDNFLVLLGSEPRRAHRFLDRLVELHLASLERFLKAVDGCIDVIVFSDDLGTQTGPQISPRMYREFFLDRHRILWARARQLSDVKVLLHCCGGVRDLIPLLIEAGVDAINPVQTSCARMDPAELKSEFGKDLVFWGGGCDTQRVLPFASARQVREHVRNRLRIWSPGGGFVFQQVHNILASVPPENIVAMYEAILGSEEVRVG